MGMTVFRFGLSLFTVASGIALFVLAGDRRRAARDPALVLLRIPLLPDTLYVAIEAAFLACALAGVPAPAFLDPLSECVQLCLGFAYIMYTYRSLRANGLGLEGYVPLAWFAAATAANLAVLGARYAFPASATSFRMANKIILAVVFFFAGAYAVSSRGRKDDFYLSTKGGFWMAFFCIAYIPFIGLAEVFSLRIAGLDPGRSVVLQAFPARELVVLAFFSVHVEPLYSRLWGTDVAPELSAREREVAALLRRGMSNGEISETLGVSVPTVKTHVRNVLSKSGAASRADFASCRAAENAP